MPYRDRQKANEARRRYRLAHYENVRARERIREARRGARRGGGAGRRRKPLTPEQKLQKRACERRARLRNIEAHRWSERVKYHRRFAASSEAMRAYFRRHSWIRTYGQLPPWLLEALELAYQFKKHAA
jgi:hypothetical protein